MILNVASLGLNGPMVPILCLDCPKHYLEAMTLSSLSKEMFFFGKFYPCASEEEKIRKYLTTSIVLP
jgi:hypothetical protein